MSLQKQTAKARNIRYRPVELEKTILGGWIHPDFKFVFSYGERTGTKKDPFILRSTDNWKR